MANRNPNFSDRSAFAQAPPQLAAVPRDIFGRPLASKLSTYAFSSVLPANAVQITPIWPTNYVEFLQAEAQAAHPRIINIQSVGGRAFDARIKWTSGGGPSNEMFVTGSGGSLQIGLTAKTLDVRLANWLNLAQQISVSVEDQTFSQRQDLHRVERQLALAAAAFQDFNLPPFARYVYVASDVPAQRPNILVTLIDDAPAAMAAFPASDGRIPIGAASRIRITNNNLVALASYTLDFELGYN